VFSHAEAKLHLYGKREGAAGRKMGHINVLSENATARSNSQMRCSRL